MSFRSFLRVSFLVCAFCSAHASDTPRVLLLVISCEKLSVYPELKKIWRSYMHSDQAHIESYFIESDPDLIHPIEILGDTILTRGEEGWVPKSSSIIDKTILSMEAFLPRLSEFDYVVRTSLSSFYIFPRLLKYLESLPKNKCYSAMPIASNSYIGSGSGYILSPDLVRRLVANKQNLIGNRRQEDDVIVGKFLHSIGILLIPHPRRDFLSLPDFISCGSDLPEPIFQIRVKTPDSNRLADDIYIQKTLLRRYYE